MIARCRNPGRGGAAAAVEKSFADDLRSTLSDYLRAGKRAAVLMAVVVCVACGGDKPKITVRSYSVVPAIVEPAPAGSGDFEVRFDVESSRESFVFLINFLLPQEAEPIAVPQTFGDLLCNRTDCPSTFAFRCHSAVAGQAGELRAITCRGRHQPEGVTLSPGDYKVRLEFDARDMFDRGEPTVVYTNVTFR